MADRFLRRDTYYRLYNADPCCKHDDQISRPGTSQRGGGYSNCHGLYKKMTFKVNYRGGNHYRKSWDSRTDLVRDQLNSELPNRNGQRYSRDSNGNFKNLSYVLRESRTGWYSVFVPYVEDFDEFLQIIQTYITPDVFYPYNKQYCHNGIRFLIDDFKFAKTLKNTSYKIKLKDNRKLIIRVQPYWPSRSTISFTPVSSEVREKMIEAMATRYNPNTKSLDLSQFYACSLFTNNQLFVPLNQPTILMAALNIVAQHTKHDLYGLSLENNHIYLSEGLIWIRRLFPELKVLDLAGNKFSHLKELRCLSGYTIHELNLSRNPVWNTEDKERYIQDIQKCFPVLNKLDNLELPSRYSPMIGSKFKMPINFGNCYPIPDGHNPELPNPVMTLVELFLTQYYVLYDNQVSRQKVSEAYHANAAFTLSSCYLHKTNKRNSLSQYLPESRNLLEYPQNRHGCQFLHKGKENILNMLEKLPKTKHDIGSFIVDVPFATDEMVQIVVNGVFAEDCMEIIHRYIFRSFCRTFCIVPFGSGWSIISDMLFVTTCTNELLVESSKRFHVFKPNPVLSQRNNINGNSNQNGAMFIENTDEIAGMESSSSSSSYQQPPTPSFPSPSFQPSPMTAPINLQQPPSYQGGMQTSTPQIQQMVPAATLNFQPDSQQQSNASFPMYNTISASTKALSTPSTPASLPAYQMSTEVPVHLIWDANANTDKLTMIKSFSNETGMNNEWAEKCLEENGWDYANATSCFLNLKPNIPPEAFIH